MKLLTFAAAAWLCTGSTAFAQVQVSLHDGLVTIVAKDTPVRQIVAEWARVGQAKVVNAERIPGGPISIELTDMPEAQALDTLLRSAAGYLAAPRAEMAANLSRFDRILVMPTSTAPRATASAAPPPVFQQPQFTQPPPVAGDDEPEDGPRPNAATPNQNRGAIFNNAFPQPQVLNPQSGAPVTVFPGQQVPQQQPTYSSTPTAPFGGVAVPGMVAPTPQQTQPGQIGTPTQPGQTRRPGGIEH